MKQKELASLLASARDGNETSRELLELHLYEAIERISRCNLFYHCMRSYRYDAIQSAWIGAREFWRSNGVEPTKFNAYVGTCAFNALKKELKKQRKWEHMHVLTEEDMEAITDIELDRTIKYGILHNVLDTLEPADYDIIRRRFWYCQKLSDIANEMGLNHEGTVHNKLKCILSSLRAALEVHMTKEEWL